MPVPADASVSKFIYAMYALKSGQDALRFRPYSVLTATLSFVRGYTTLPVRINA